jgi:hypothetical protein
MVLEEVSSFEDILNHLEGPKLLWGGLVLCSGNVGSSCIALARDVFAKGAVLLG